MDFWIRLVGKGEVVSNPYSTTGNHHASFSSTPGPAADKKASRAQSIQPWTGLYDSGQACLDIRSAEVNGD